MERSSSRIRYVLMGGWLPVAPPWLKVLIDLWLIAIAVGIVGTLAGNIQVTWIMFPLWAVRLWFAWAHRPREGDGSS